MGWGGAAFDEAARACCVMSRRAVDRGLGELSERLGCCGAGQPGSARCGLGSAPLKLAMVVVGLDEPLLSCHAAVGRSGDGDVVWARLSAGGPMSGLGALRAAGAALVETGGETTVPPLRYDPPAWLAVVYPAARAGSVPVTATPSVAPTGGWSRRPRPPPRPARAACLTGGVGDGRLTTEPTRRRRRRRRVRRRGGRGQGDEDRGPAAMAVPAVTSASAAPAATAAGQRRVAAVVAAMGGQRPARRGYRAVCR